MTINIAMDKKGHSTKSKSPYFGFQNRGNVGKRGRRPYEPSHIYRYLWDNTDQHGVLMYSIIELAETAVVDPHLFNYFISDMKELGFMEDHGKGFRMVKSPKQIEWSDELYDKLDVLRKRHFSKYKNKKEKTI